jgi:hypothetical protein
MDEYLPVPALNAEPTRSMIRKWPQELKNQRKKKLHSKQMERYRYRRAADKKNMLDEKCRLEIELERRLQKQRCDGVSLGDGDQRDMQRLVLEREALRDESVALRQEIAKCTKFQRVIHGARDKLVPQLDEQGSHADSINTTVRLVDSIWKPVQEQGGWRVHFPGGDPSFVFHPFSRSEFDTILRRHDAKASAKSTDLKLTGNFLGWSVYHGATMPGNRGLVGHARCSKRVNRSLDSIMDSMRNDDGSSKWPVMPTSRDLDATAEISIQTLQELDESSSVIVRSYSGSINCRYMCVVQRSRPQLIDGKRALKFYYLIGDSEANARSRDTEPSAGNDVCWIIEEVGCSLTLVEVDQSTVEVIFDSFAVFETSGQALRHFTKFGRLVMRWEQLVLAPNLLKLD